MKKPLALLLCAALCLCSWPLPAWAAAPVKTNVSAGGGGFRAPAAVQLGNLMLNLSVPQAGMPSVNLPGSAPSLAMPGAQLNLPAPEARVAAVAQRIAQTAPLTQSGDNASAQGPAAVSGNSSASGQAVAEVQGAPKGTLQGRSGGSNESRILPALKNRPAQNGANENAQDGKDAQALAAADELTGVDLKELTQAVDSVMGGLSPSAIAQMSEEEFAAGAEKILAVLQSRSLAKRSALTEPGLLAQAPGLAGPAANTAGAQASQGQVLAAPMTPASVRPRGMRLKRADAPYPEAPSERRRTVVASPVAAKNAAAPAASGAEAETKETAPDPEAPKKSPLSYPQARVLVDSVSRMNAAFYAAAAWTAAAVMLVTMPSLLLTTLAANFEAFAALDPLAAVLAPALAAAAFLVAARNSGRRAALRALDRSRFSNPSWIPFSLRLLLGMVKNFTAKVRAALDLGSAQETGIAERYVRNEAAARTYGLAQGAIALVLFLPLFPLFIFNGSEIFERLTLMNRAGDIYMWVAGGMAATAALIHSVLFWKARRAVMAGAALKDAAGDARSSAPRPRLRRWLVVPLLAFTYALLQPSIAPPEFGELAYDAPAMSSLEGLPYSPAAVNDKKPTGAWSAAFSQSRGYAQNYLLAAQSQDGSWGADAQIGSPQFRAAVTAIVLDAVEGAPNSEAARRRGSDYFRKMALMSGPEADREWQAFFRHTLAPYAIGYGTMRLVKEMPAAGPERAEYERAIKAVLARLKSEQIQYGAASLTAGSFQAAVVGQALLDAEAAGIPIPRSAADPSKSMIDVMVERFERHRLPHGGWGYYLHGGRGGETWEGTASRDPLIELFLFRAYQRDAGRTAEARAQDRQRLAQALTRYIAVRPQIAKIADTPDEDLEFMSVLGIPSPHTTLHGIAKYYLYFGTYWAARAMEPLADDPNWRHAARWLGQQLLNEQGADAEKNGSVLDSAIYTGRQYSTAELARALGVLEDIVARDERK